MGFPTLVYRCPGHHQCPGGTFDYRPIETADQLEQALAAGWFETLPQAMAGERLLPAKPAEKIGPQAETTEDITPPRAELEQEARHLKIKFTKRTPDADLFALIKQAYANGGTASDELD